MELILVVVVAMIMALISLSSILLQTHMTANNHTEWQWQKHRIPARENIQLAVSIIEDTAGSDYKKQVK